MLVSSHKTMFGSSQNQNSIAGPKKGTPLKAILAAVGAVKVSNPLGLLRAFKFLCFVKLLFYLITVLENQDSSSKTACFNHVLSLW